MERFIDDRGRWRAPRAIVCRAGWEQQPEGPVRLSSSLALAAAPLLASRAPSASESEFPVLAKTEVKRGPGQSPHYAELTARTGEVPGWNFCKYVIDRNGQVTHYANSAVKPTDESLRAAIDAALAAD